jgi:hypothetical protein
MGKLFGKIFQSNSSAATETHDKVDRQGREILSPDPYNNIPRQTVKKEVRPQQPAEGGDAASATGSTAPSRPPLLTPPGEPQIQIAPPEFVTDPAEKKPSASGATAATTPPANKLKATMTLDNPKNPLGLADAQARLKTCNGLIAQKQFDVARVQLQPLKQWLVDATESHIGLYKALDNVATARAQAELEKQIALQFALLRDQAIYLHAKLEIADKNYPAAIKSLTDVIKSQPRNELGMKSYQLLQDIGFTEKLQLAE